jgi:hypothetical protein
MKLLAWIAITMTVAIESPAVRDVDGRVHHPFAPAGKASVLIFLTSDCPISNAYAPAIQDVCRASAPNGVECLLVYEDPAIETATARAHLKAYGYSGIPAAIDRDGALAGAATASVTPEAVLIDRTGAPRYRGRIDNLYVDLGRRRPAATVHDLRDAIDTLLAGQPIARLRTEAYGCYITPPRGRSQESK